MIIEFDWNNQKYSANLQEGTDLSISYKEEFSQVNCFNAPFFSAQPVKMGNFTGSIEAGSPVNFYNSFINIHGGGTHTEGVGHIARERQSVNKILTQYFGVATLVSVYPTKMENGDRVITKQSLNVLMDGLAPSDFLILRTLPNLDSKKTQHYSGTNPTYLEPEACQWICDQSYKHLLVDLPSVDREQDGGILAAHHLFWAGDRRLDCTITELIYVPDHLKDGYYFINLQVASIESDASPSRPVIFSIQKR